MWQLRSHEVELTKSRQKVHQLDQKLTRQRRINRQLRRSLQQRDDDDQSAAAAIAAAAATHVDILTSEVRL